MKKGFSLIEIMQTVILLGIIAGLSISFFKRINVDERVYTATESKLKVAVEEVNRQICNDSTPYCIDSTNNIVDRWDKAGIQKTCSAAYGAGVDYNKDSGYCLKEQQGNVACPASMTYQELYGGCIAMPVCNNAAHHVQPIHEITCPDNTPNYDIQLPAGGTNIPIFCYYMHSIISHKPQGTGDADLLKTCSGSVAFKNDATFLGINTAGKSTYEQITSPLLTQVQINRAVTAAKADASIGDNYNMLLPNGARLYNLSSIRGTAVKPGVIYIKYDRLDKIDTANTSNLKGIVIVAPTAPAP